MLKTSLLSRFVYTCAIAGLFLASCAPATPAIGGIVQGAVYGDMNGNGSIDPGEVVLNDAEVILADCGPNQSQVTGPDGLFNFSNLPAGTCHVSVTKAGWLFSGSFPSIGYPVPVASNPASATSFNLFLAPVLNNNPSVSPPPPGPTESPTPVPNPTSVSPTPVLIPTSSAAMVTPKTEPANCRYGPATAFSSVGGLANGSTVPIYATIAGMSWWQIESPQNPGTYCWVSAAVTNTFGNLALVPIVPIPTGLVTSVAVSVSSGAVLHGFCGGPNVVNFQVTITTNGPATVVYHVSIYNGDGTFLNSPGDVTLTFIKASTQSFDPGGAYKTDCGKYYIKAIVTSPNSMSAQADWSVVQP